MPGSRGAIISATAADARDVLIEGVSGILSVHPEDERPLYEPSKRRITWDNGTIATVFTADKPDRLRGPQFHWAICDELCLVKGTQITTVNGQVAIEQVRAGDLVWTRQGLKRVKAAWCSSLSAQVYRLTASDGRELIGTANHPIWVKNKGFTPLRFLEYGDIMMAWDIKQNSEVQTKNCLLSHQFGGMGDDTGLTAATTWIDRVLCCIALFIFTSMAKSLKDGKSTISTATRRIILLTTSLLCQSRSMSSCIGKRNGKTENPTEKKRKKLAIPCGKIESRLLESVKTAAMNLQALERVQNTAQIAVRENITEDCTSILKVKRNQNAQGNQPPFVGTVGKTFSPTLLSCNTVPHLAAMQQNAEPRKFALSVVNHSTPEILTHNAALDHAATHIELSVVKVETVLHRQPVYNLEVEECHEYFANGILTHNCAWRFGREAYDMLMFGLRLGENPQCAIATTPKRTPLLKEILNDRSTVTTKGSTYENQDNLAAGFFRNTIVS